jgi:cell division septation protein DedD
MQQPNSSSTPLHTSVRIVLMSMDENGNTSAYPPNLAQEFISHLLNPFGAFPFPTQSFGNHASFEDFLDHLMRTHEPRGSPPTSKETIQKLEQITIGNKEVEDKTECAICKDAFSLEDTATRLPCTHLYHPTCILKWLEMHSTCPVCRFQLPTESQESTSGSSSSEPSASSSATPTPSSTQTPPTPTPEPSAPSPTPTPNETPSTEPSTIPASIRIISIETHDEQDDEEEWEEAKCAFGRTRREECTLVNGEREFVSLTCGCTYHTECLESFLRISGELNIGSSIYEESTPFRCPTCKQNAVPVQPLDVD